MSQFLRVLVTLPQSEAELMRNTDDCDQSFQRIATSVTRVRDGTVG